MDADDLSVEQNLQIGITFDEEQDPGLHPHQSEESDPDTDVHKNESRIRMRLKVRRCETLQTGHRLVTCRAYGTGNIMMGTLLDRHFNGVVCTVGFSRNLKCGT